MGGCEPLDPVIESFVEIVLMKSKLRGEVCYGGDIVVYQLVLHQPRALESTVRLTLMRPS